MIDYQVCEIHSGHCRNGLTKRKYTRRVTNNNGS